MNLLNIEKHCNVVFQQQRNSFVQMQGLADLISFLPCNIVVAEIGSYAGESAQMFLNSNKVNKIYCIDPWKNFVDRSDNALHINMHKIKCMFEDRFKFDKRVVQVVGTIDDFIEKFDLPKIDVVYIDANHEYAYAKNDILKSIRCLKPTFAVSGHDYEMHDVKKAVNDTIGLPDKVFVDSSWLKFL